MVADSEPEEFSSLQESLVDGPRATVDLRTDVAHSARIYDYFLGGKDNFPADRQAAAQIQAAFPHTPAAAVQNRAFLVRTVRYLAQAGIRQFLDIGTGIPTRPNLHEVVQAVAPQSRVVYADNDPIVLAHARALLTSDARGRTAYLDADLRDPGRILAAPELLDTIDLTQPVALSVIAVLHFVPVENDQYGIIRTLVDALPSGSYLTMSYLTADHNPDQVAKLVSAYRAQGIDVTARTQAEVAQFFQGLDLITPGIVPLHLWRPDDPASAGDPATEAGGNIVWSAVGQKP
ncbi:SAM-dependent methyltransferase [Frankia sp. AgB1.9]|uniref:SAM-dependent methyltransferase n=1 Tax=unclassified Frankia TaxID=2632575 RepID=UPI001933EFF2|nr:MULTISPECIES: SAM-dependent methyltransferase [unclassified Frankia]MBL7487956.1 SAM-dependent methyltransferase [Frankia sp. AgW1.1]MBL7550399.1 SAM-dependent methyltransferase [Frankia sp. AgB1.9]MBL7620869.1 SAM-dependent methyltransferase [Frankia sp. AgB1.8]